MIADAIFNAWTISSPFAVIAAYHFGRAQGIESASKTDEAALKRLIEFTKAGAEA
jgi:hypothetical protein